MKKINKKSLVAFSAILVSQAFATPVICPTITCPAAVSCPAGQCPAQIIQNGFVWQLDKQFRPAQTNPFLAAIASNQASEGLCHYGDGGPSFVIYHSTASVTHGQGDLGSWGNNQQICTTSSANCQFNLS